MSIGQRWPEAEMRKCEVIFARSLRPQVVFKKPGYGTKYVFTFIIEIVQQISNTKGCLQLSEMIPTSSSWLITVITDGSFLLVCYFSKVSSWIATHPTRTQRVILCGIARHLDMPTPPSHPLISFENDSSPVVTANGSHLFEAPRSLLRGIFDSKEV